jgi:hypothetical protein
MICPTGLAKCFLKEGWTAQITLILQGKMVSASNSLVPGHRHQTRGTTRKRGWVGRRHETLLTTGQTSGGIDEILPVAEIIRQLTAEAETVLLRGPSLTSRCQRLASAAAMMSAPRT